MTDGRTDRQKEQDNNNIPELSFESAGRANLFRVISLREELIFCIGTVIRSYQLSEDINGQYIKKLESLKQTGRCELLFKGQTSR